MKKIICVLYTISSINGYCEDHQKNAYVHVGYINEIKYMYIEYEGNKYITNFPEKCLD